MTNHDPKRVQQLFLRVVELSSDERESVLKSECGDDQALFHRVTALLKAHDEPDSFLPTFATDVARGVEIEATQASAGGGTAAGGTVEYHAAGQPGRIIAGRYKLQERIGEGGMGEVWVARQSEPVKRKVAIKLIKAGMDSRSVLSRFEQERQALAIMDHPNIARVLDGGMTETGHPFFVMELVNGLPLNQFCDQAKLTPSERMELFIPICKAVQHAHQKGIVHRDLKPANILVTLIDGQPIPKVIDFGVAKATGGQLTDHSLSTQFGAVVGTLEYMSPEQAGYSAVDVDTRSDIYSLGVILYELLTGLRPIDARQLRQAGLAEMLRVIHETEPARPSTRCSTDDAFPSFAALRGTEPRKLTALLRGELDWVIMKCLEKQRDRRYDSAAGLARDIQRILSNEPVEARPPSAVYRLRKLVSRHKASAAATALTVLALVIGIAGTSIGLYQAETQRGRAEAAMNAEAERAEGERKAKEELGVRLAQIEKSNGILLSVFAGMNPDYQENDDLPLVMVLAENLDEAVKELEANEVGDPEMMVLMRRELGHTLTVLGQPEKGLPILEKTVAFAEQTLGDDHRLTLGTRSLLAGALGYSGRLEEALELLQRTYRQAVSLFGEEDPEAVYILANLGAAYQSTGDFENAVPVLEKAVELLGKTEGVDAEATLRAMNNLATAYGGSELKTRSIPLLEEVYRLTREKLGPDHPTTYLCMANLGDAYHRARIDDKARPLLEEAYQRVRKNLGPDHPQTLDFMIGLADYYRDHGLVDLVLPLLEQAAKLNEVKYGRFHEKTFDLQNRLAASLWSNGEMDQAIPMLEELLRREEVTLGSTAAKTLLTKMNLGANYMDVGQGERALPLLEEAFEHAEVNPSLLEAAGRISQLYLEAGRLEEALEVLQQAYDKRVALEGEGSFEAWKILSAIGSTHYANKNLDVSIPIFEDLIAKQEAEIGREHLVTLQAIRNLAINYQAAGQHAKAIALFEEILNTLKDHPELEAEMPSDGIGAEYAVSLISTGKEARAVEILESGIETLRKSEPESDGLRVALRTLAAVAWKNRDFETAIELNQELLVRCQQFLGLDHSDTLTASWNLASNYFSARKLPESIELFETLREQLEAHPEIKFDPTRERLILSLAVAYQASEQSDQAIVLIEDWLRKHPEPTGVDPLGQPPDLRHHVAVLYYRKEDYDKAIPHLEEALQVNMETSETATVHTVRLLSDLAVNYEKAGRYAEAVEHFEKAFDHQGLLPAVASMRLRYLACCQMIGEHEKVVEVLSLQIPLARIQLPEGSPALAGQLATLGLSQLALKDYTGAEGALRECLEIREKTAPDVWTTYNTMSMLGEALLEQEKLDEALPLLQRGYQGMFEQRETLVGFARKRMGESIERLVRYGERAEDAALTDRWREELERWQAEEAEGEDANKDANEDEKKE